MSRVYNLIGQKVTVNFKINTKFLVIHTDNYSCLTL